MVRMCQSKRLSGKHTDNTRSCYQWNSQRNSLFKGHNCLIGNHLRLCDPSPWNSYLPTINQRCSKWSGIGWMNSSGSEWGTKRLSWNLTNLWLYLHMSHKDTTNTPHKHHCLLSYSTWHEVSHNSTRLWLVVCIYLLYIALTTPVTGAPQWLHKCTSISSGVNTEKGLHIGDALNKSLKWVCIRQCTAHGNRGKQSLTDQQYLQCKDVNSCTAKQHSGSL